LKIYKLFSMTWQRKDRSVTSFNCSWTKVSTVVLIPQRSYSNIDFYVTDLSAGILFPPYLITIQCQVFQCWQC
jgi:hypothetical protein